MKHAQVAKEKENGKFVQFRITTTIVNYGYF